MVLEFLGLPTILLADVLDPGFKCVQTDHFAHLCQFVVRFRWARADNTAELDIREVLRGEHVDCHAAVANILGFYCTADPLHADHDLFLYLVPVVFSWLERLQILLSHTRTRRWLNRQSAL